MSSIDFTTRPHNHFPLRGSVLAGLALLAAFVALALTGDPAAESRAPASAYASPELIEDWRGNSASILPAQQ